jgi:hypothetical protein
MLGGQQQHGPFAGAFDEIASGGSRTPWGGSEGGDLAREAGLQDIGRGSERAGLFGGDQDTDRGAGLLDTAENDSGIEESDVDDDVDTGSDDTDYA